MKVYSVTEFRQEINELLGQVTVVIEGEVSGFHISQNRFVWFSLADDKTVIDCFMMTFQLRKSLEDGMQVRVTGSPTLFTKGKFVFRPRQVDIVGEGSLQRAFELLKQQLEKEGLFDESRKRSLPRFPQRIGLVTSADAAAYTDILRILKNRWAGLEIRHANVNVQGAQAIPSIVFALQDLNKHHTDLDCMILSRGGGSLEDLQAFNSEEVVRAIFASTIPVVCGIGHERDITLSDLVADVRASTPSNAAEIVVPDKEDILNEVDYSVQRIEAGLQSVLQDHRERISTVVQSLDQRARKSIEHFVDIFQRLQFSFQRYAGEVDLHKERLQSMTQLLRSLHPQHILERGYTMTTDLNRNVIRSRVRIRAGDRLITKFADGEVRSTVDLD